MCMLVIFSTDVVYGGHKLIGKAARKNYLRLRTFVGNRCVHNSKGESQM